MDKNKYALRGVSAGKEEVHAAIKNLEKGLYPKAFCKILPDFVANDPHFCNIMHADTAGTKTSLAYMYWKATGDLSVWNGILQDSIVMNLDDMAAVGCVNDIVLSSTIGRNKNLISGDVIKTLIQGTVAFAENLKKYGVNIHLAGGETADVGDIVRTIDVGYTTFARMKREDLIINDIKPGNVIVGLASYGQATYETEYNSGIGSNGLTSARHDVLNKKTAQTYPDAFDPNTPEEVIFTGNYEITDTWGLGVRIRELGVSGEGEKLEYFNEKNTKLTIVAQSQDPRIKNQENSKTATPQHFNTETLSIKQLLLSPTRTYLPVLTQILEQCKGGINGIIHCTGGGQTKVLHFTENVHIIKDNLFKTPPVFQLIQQQSGTDLKEMYQVFNMGHRMELYVQPEIAEQIIEIAQSFNIDAKIVGRVEEN